MSRGAPLPIAASWPLVLVVSVAVVLLSVTVPFALCRAGSSIVPQGQRDGTTLRSPQRVRRTSVTDSHLSSAANGICAALLRMCRFHASIGHAWTVLGQQASSVFTLLESQPASRGQSRLMSCRLERLTVGQGRKWVVWPPAFAATVRRPGATASAAQTGAVKHEELRRIADLLERRNRLDDEIAARVGRPTTQATSRSGSLLRSSMSSSINQPPRPSGTATSAPVHFSGVRSTLIGTCSERASST